MNMQPGRVIKIVKRESHEEILKNPYLLVMLAITIAGAIFGLNKASHVFAPIFFIAALAGMGWLAWQEWKAEKAEAKALDYTQARGDRSQFVRAVVEGKCARSG